MMVPQVDNEKLVHWRHPQFWLEDGSLIISIENDMFKVHRTLLCRHSHVLAKWSGGDDNERRLAPAANGSEAVLLQVPQDVAERLRSKDMLVLLEHLYHDV